MVDSEGSAGAGEAPPAKASRSSARRGFLRRWARRLAWSAALGIVVLVALYLTRDRLLHPALCRAATWAGARAGYEVRLDRLRTDWWSHAALEGLDVRSTTEGGALRVLELDRARAEFSVPGLVRGGLDGLGRLELGTGRVELDVRGDPDTDAREAPEGDGTFSLPEALPRIAAESIAVRLATDAGTLAVDDFHAAAGARTHVVDARRVAWSGGVDVVAPVTVQLDWKGGGRVAFRGLEVGAAVRGGEGEVDLSRIAEGTLALSAEFGLPEDGRAVARLSLANGALEVTLEESRLALAPTVAAVAAVGLPTPGLDTLAGVANLRGTLRAGAGTRGFESRVELEGRDVEYEERRTDALSAVASIGPEGIRFDRVEATDAEQFVVATDTTLPFGDILSGLSGSVRMRIDDLPRWIRGPAPTSGAAPREVPPHRLVLSGQLGAGRVRLDGGRLEVAGGHVDLGAGALDLVPAAGGARRLDVDLTVDLPELAAVGELLGNEGWSGRVSGGIRLTGPLAAPVGHADLTGDDVEIAGVRFGSVSLEADADGNEIRITRLASTSDRLQARASGAWRVRTARLEDARLELELGGLEAFGFASGGTLSLTARADGPWDAPTGTLSLTGSNLALGDTPLEDFAIEASADGGAVTVSRAGARTPYGEASLSGAGTVSPAGRVDFELASLAVSAGDSDLRLAAPVRFVRDADALDVGRFELAGRAGELAGEARLAGGEWTGSLNAVSLRLDDFLASRLPAGASTGTVDASFSATGFSTGPDGSLDFDLRVTDLVVAENALPATVALDGSLEAATVELESLSVALAGTEVLNANGSLPLPHLRPDAPLDLTVDLALTDEIPVAFPLRGETARLEGEARGEVSLRGSWKEPRGAVTLTGERLALAPRELGAPFLGDPGRIDLALELNEFVELTRLQVVLPGRLEATAKGDLKAPLDFARLARGDLDALLATPVSAKGIVTISDPAWAAESLGARRVGGNWRADGLVGGTLGAPEVEGNVAVQAGSIKYAGVPEIEQLALDLGLSSAGIEIRRAAAELGSAPVTLTGSVRRGDAGLEADLAISGENVLLQRSSRLRLRGDVSLALTGPPEDLLLAGEVHLVNSRFLQQIDFLSLLDVRGNGVSSAQRGLVLPSFREGPLSTTRLDVDVTTREPVSLLGNVARGKIGLDLNVGGTGEVIVPTGVVFLDEARVALPGGPMRFERGLVTFRQEDPYVPRVDLSGESRLAGYDLEVRVEGPLDDLQIESSSSPPLDRRDALLLVLTGRIPPSGEATSTAAQSLGLYLAKDLARRWTSASTLSDEDEDGLLDRLLIVSGQDVSRSGVMTFEVSYRTFDDLLDDEDAVFVVGERDVYEEYNIGLRFLFRSR